MKKRVISSILAICLTSMLFSFPVMAKDVYDVPSNSSFKTFMSYKAITSRNSKQYKLQEKCVTDENGLRTYNGRYTIALGNYFGISVGDYVDVELSTGVVLNCVVGDVKQNRHTNGSNMQVAHNGNIVEFIVGPGLPQSVKSSGDVSKLDGFEGYIKTITVYDEEDTSSIEFNRFVISDDLVTDKYDLVLPDGSTVYTIETITSTFTVDADVYNSIAIGDAFSIGG